MSDLQKIIATNNKLFAKISGYVTAQHPIKLESGEEVNNLFEIESVLIAIHPGRHSSTAHLGPFSESAVAIKFIIPGTSHGEQSRLGSSILSLADK